MPTIAIACSPSSRSPLAVRSGRHAGVTAIGVEGQSAAADTRLLPRGRVREGSTARIALALPAQSPLESQWPRSSHAPATRSRDLSRPKRGAGSIRVARRVLVTLGDEVGLRPCVASRRRRLRQRPADWRGRLGRRGRPCVAQRGDPDIGQRWANERGEVERIGWRRRSLRRALVGAVEDCEAFDIKGDALYARIVTTGGRASVTVRVGRAA